MSSRIRYEFWNGQTSRKKKYAQYEGLVTTKHNPCLWTSVGTVCEDCSRQDINQPSKNESEPTLCTNCKPWRGVYVSASEVLDKWEKGELNDTDFLHHLRYVAYGIGKREFDNAEVVWPGNLTTEHRPKLSVERDDGSIYTIRFVNEGNDDDPIHGWTATRDEGATFYWTL